MTTQKSTKTQPPKVETRQIKRKMNNLDFSIAYAKALKDDITIQEFADRIGYTVQGADGRIKRLAKKYKKQRDRELPVLRRNTKGEVVSKEALDVLDSVFE